MKHSLLKATALALLGLGVGLTSARAQVILNPAQISGTLQFNNANSVILDLLNAPGNEGMSNVVVNADSVPPAPPIHANSEVLPAAARTSTGYHVTVDAGSPGIAYAVGPTVTLLGENYTYWFKGATSAPVVIGGPATTLDFGECVGVVTIHFVTPAGDPVPVDGGLITAYDSVTGEYTGQLGALVGGVTEQHLFLRGGATHRVDITVHRGTNSYLDRIESFLSTNVVVTCDEFISVDMVLPDSGTLGTVTGTVDMLREFELTIAGRTDLHYPDYTSVLATLGPFSNQRWAAVPGVNFTAPSSGAFTLANVVPSTLDPASLGYLVNAQMAFRTNRAVELFITPALGSGLNPPLVVSPGASIGLSNLFVINPGYLRGKVTLQGPPESLGHASLLRGVYHAGDDVTDGIPTYFGTYGVYWSTIEAVGVDRLAPGATFSASSGVGVADFDGTFNPATSAYEGQYELVLGGLAGQRSVWKPYAMNFTLTSGTVTNDSDYYYNVFGITDVTTNDVEVVPNQPVTNDVAYCFGEVKVVFRSTSGTFYSPQIRFSSGSFTGTDFQGKPANYTVDYNIAGGTPVDAGSATNTGVVTMFLPEGTYTLQPSVVPGSGSVALAGLEPINVTVGCHQRISLEPCLQLSLDAPGCSNTNRVHITGSVRSCTNNVTSISYTLNGGPSQTICTGCGSDPSFAFELLLANECQDNTLIVTATDASGGVSSVTTSIHYDVTPPQIQCPADMIVGSCDTNGATATFNVTATDNCTGPLSIVCVPASGSLFPVGTTTVHCTATDQCGNSSQCSFNVTVGTGASQVSISQAVAIQWTCSGTLQSADNLSGPWTDIPGATSPYFAVASAAQKFYRVKQ